MSKLLQAVSDNTLPDIAALIDRVYDAHSRRSMRERARKMRGHETYFHPSMLGKCPREIYYGMTEEAGPPEPGLARVFDNGDFMHMRFQERMFRHRSLVGAFHCQRCGFKTEEYGFRPAACPKCKRKSFMLFKEIGFLDHDNRVSWRPDGIVHHQGKFFWGDFKSMNTHQYSNMTRPPAKHIRQLNFYMNAAPVVLIDGEWVEMQSTGILIYEDKNTQDTSKPMWVDRDAEMYRDDLKFISSILRCVENETVPKRLDSYTRSSYACKKCSFREICYKKS